MQLAPLIDQARATLILDNRTLNAEIEVVMQSTLGSVTWNNPMAALATVNRLSGLSKLGAITAIGSDGGDPGGGTEGGGASNDDDAECPGAPAGTTFNMCPGIDCPENKGRRCLVQKDCSIKFGDCSQVYCQEREIQLQ